jgi:hypothetical protein
MTVLIYVDSSKQVGDRAANADAAEAWFAENDPEGVAFEYDVLERKRLETASTSVFSSFDNSARNSASSRFPANWAAMSDWYPSPVILMPNGLLLRCISQLQRSGFWPVREVTT